jgi:protein-L-isoaspartate(D-aspartate) O-methyltransferase
MSEFAQRRVTMVDSQVRPSDVTKFPIIAAMLIVPREAYVPAGREEAAYLGDNLEIAPGRVMLEPRTLAKMLDALDLQPSERVMDLGTGLGYAAAVLAEMVAEVVAVEEDPALAAEATRRLAGLRNVRVHHGALSAGAAGPFDAIIVQGGVEQVPEAILSQLKDHGRIAALFMTGALGTVRIGHKAGGQVTWRFAFNAAGPILPGFSAGRGFVL